MLFSLDSLVRSLERLLPGSRSPKAPSSMRWIPAVTFWQLIVDMWLGTSDALPDGSGHRYSSASYIDEWIALTRPKAGTLIAWSASRSTSPAQATSTNPKL